MRLWWRIAALCWVCSATAGWAAEGPIAVVNGVPISREDFVRNYENQAAHFIAQGVPRDLLRNFGIHKQVLEQLINAELIGALIKARGVKIPDSAVKEDLEALKKESSLDQEAYLAYAKKAAGTVERFEAMVRTALAAEKIFAEVDATVTVTGQEVHDRCRKSTDLASLAFVEFEAAEFVSEVKPPTDKVLAAWAKAHQVEVDAAFTSDARAVTSKNGVFVFANSGVPVITEQTPSAELVGNLFAIMRKRVWVVGDETKIRNALALEHYVAAQASSLARREAEKALAVVKKGKKLEALFPEAISRTQPFSPLDEYGAGIPLTPALVEAVFTRKTPGPLATVVTVGEREVVAVVEMRQVLRESVCQAKAEASRAELLQEKKKAGRDAFLKALRDKATITTDQVAVDRATLD